MDWDQHDRKMGRTLAKRMLTGAEKRERWLSKTSQKLSKEYAITNCRALRELLVKLQTLPFDVPSHPDFDNWSIPKDLSAWKDVRPKLVELAAHLDSARTLLGSILDDPVLHAALMREDEDRQLPILIDAIHEFSEIAISACSLSGKRGNRPHPEWRIEATRLCRGFWREHKGEEPRSYFNQATKPKAEESAANITTQPGNDFSRWFCEVMEQLFKIVPSQCQTLLRHKGHSR